MNIREKLVEIVKRAAYNCLPSNTQDFNINLFVTDLLAHGVTVQEWISVKNGLPKDRDWVLVNHTGYATPKKAKYKDDFSPHLPVFLIDGDNGNKGEVTHWMPLPQLPKGE